MTEQQQQLVFHLLKKAQEGDKEEGLVKKMEMDEEHLLEEQDEGEERLVKMAEKLATEAQEEGEATKNYPGDHTPQTEHTPKNFQLNRLLLKMAQEEGEEEGQVTAHLGSKNTTLPPPPTDSLQFLRDLQVLSKGQRRARRDTCKQVG